MKRLSLFIILPFFTIAGAFAQTGAWEFFGSESVAAAMTLDGNYGTGFSSKTSLGMEYTPDTGPGFRAEGSVSWGYGIASPEAMAFDAGLAEIPAVDTLPPGFDLHRKTALDQAYAKFSYSVLDAKIGLIPVSWGSGYVFNPVARTTRPIFPGSEDETMEGRLGAIASIAFPHAISLEAYALAEPRLRSPVPSIGEIDPGKEPFGARLLTRSDSIDLSLSILRSLMSADTEPEWRAGMDASGFLGAFTLYTEIAVRLPSKYDSGNSRFDLATDVDACAGFSYLISFIETTLRAEAAWLGDGSEDVAAYDRLGIIAGNRTTLGKAYLFGMTEKAVDDRWKAGIGVLLNIFDASAAWIAEASWSPMSSLELMITATYFSGSGSSEFGGTMMTGLDTVWDPFIPAISLSTKASF
ncbi:MAG: hypothetical protein E4H20_01805 [Spirochaetales bacterium]|nr:MAG: hypothetical protein E4H20_01805 [Spirochaetales bacterium]